MVAEHDDVDTESLQAQIDMSMSFAHNLVTSWIKPTHLAQPRSSGANATQILEELRRPPRLGVGASIPTAPRPAHEAPKLKRKLGKFEASNEVVVDSQLQDSSKSDNEEHKGRPTKRKTKTDPFGQEGTKKKRKVESTAKLYPSAENIPKHPVTLPQNSASEEPAKHNSFSRQEKQGMRPDDQQSHATEGQRSATSVSSPPLVLPVQTTFSSSLTAPTVHSLSGPSLRTSAPVPGKLTTPGPSRVHTNYMPKSDKAKPLGIPLLNLGGPPELTDEPGNTNESNKKKRKRRKKRKVAGVR